MQVPDRFYKKFAELQPKLLARDASQEDILMTRAALAMCENIDWNVGRVLGQVQKLGLDRDTIVVYFSDNGPNSWRWNGGMKGRKGSLDEGGLRVPCLIRWPGRIPPGTRIPQIAGAIDLLATLTALAGVQLPKAKPLDGVDLTPLLTRQAKNWPDRMIFSMQNRRAGVRTQQYRLSPDGQLFDMTADPMQDRNIAAEHSQVATRLAAAVEAWTREVMPPDEDARAFTVGYSHNTLLPARDGVPHGGIERSSRHPNCSFFRNWLSKADSMTWDIEVGRAGIYEGVMYYTCPAGQTGSTIELSFHDAVLRGRISEAFDPPLVGETQDRAPRTESFSKDFKPLSLGTFRLPKLRGLLTLRAPEVHAQQVADVRYVALKFIA